MPKYKRRPDGRLQSQIYLGRDENGKRKYKVVYAETQKELDQKVLEVREKLNKGINLSAAGDNFDEWGKRWLKRKETKVCAKTYESNLCNYKKLSPLFHRTVGKLKCVDLEDILIDLQKQGYANKTLRAVKQIADGVMRDCVKNRVIEYNPFSDAEIPKSLNDDEHRRALTEEEQRWINDTPHRAQTAAMIMMYAGIRRGELIPLLWSDIDLEEGTIKITKSVEMVKGQPVLKDGGKTKAATRTIYIPQRLIDYLKTVERDSFLVVHMKNGKMHTATSWKRLWESYIKDLNFKYGDFGNFIVDGKPYQKPRSKMTPGGVPIIIPKFTAHWLRHTFITMMYMAGVDVLTAAKQAGHADIKVTMGIYTHLDEQYKKKNIDKLNAFLGRQDDASQMQVNGDENPLKKAE